MNTLSFDHPDLARRVEGMSTAQRDALAFGAIKLDADGQVSVYNATEGRQSGYRDRPALRRDFFLEVAPCMGVPAFKGQIENLRAAGQLDIEFGWVGDFDDPEREMRIRVISALDGGQWIFIDRRHDP